MACHDQMLAWLLKRGLPPYRLGIQSIDELGLPNDAMHNCFVACVTNSILWVSLRQDVMLINSQVSMHRLQSGEHWEYLSFTFPAFRHWLCPLDEANVLAWGAQDGQGQPVGLVLGHIGTSPAGTRVMELKSVYISPSARRHGLATRLLQAWIDDCRVQGFDELQSAPWIPNDLYPFYHEENAESLTSLALKLKGQVKGWVINHSVDKVLRFTCSHLHPQLQRIGCILLLYNKAVALMPQAGFDTGMWTVPVWHEGMPSGAMKPQPAIYRVMTP